MNHESCFLCFSATCKTAHITCFRDIRNSYVCRVFCLIDCSFSITFYVLLLVFKRNNCSIIGLMCETNCWRLEKVDYEYKLAENLSRFNFLLAQKRNKIADALNFRVFNFSERFFVYSSEL